MFKNDNIFECEIIEGYKKLGETPTYNEERSAIMNLCSNLEGKSVMELGSGSDENCVTFSNRGATRVVGIELSKKDFSSDYSDDNRENICFKNMEVENISKLGNKFDVIFSSLMVHYIKNFRGFLHDIYGLLNENGYFIFSQEHPLTTAPISGAHWTRDEKLNILHYDLTDYRRDGERIVSWITEGITKYHRCFSEIVNSLVNEGFIIEEMLEPIPTKEVMERLPYYEKGMHKPNYLIIKARKI